MCMFYNVTANVEVFDKVYGVSDVEVKSFVRFDGEDAEDVYLGVNKFLSNLFNHSVCKIKYLSLEIDNCDDLPF